MIFTTISCLQNLIKSSWTSLSKNKKPRCRRTRKRSKNRTAKMLAKLLKTPMPPIAVGVASAVAAPGKTTKKQTVMSQKMRRKKMRERMLRQRSNKEKKFPKEQYS